MAKLPTGIRLRHSRTCPATADTAAICRCTPAYEASVYSARDRKKLRKVFGNLSEARAWRHDTAGAVRRGMMRASTTKTLRQAADEWLTGAQDGTIRNRSGDEYKPSVVRGYRALLENRVLPEFGAAKLSAVSRRDLQDFADRLVAEGLDPSTIRNTLMPVRTIYRRAVSRGDVSVNPTSALELPAVRGRRDRIASPAEASSLIAALPEGDRALWATAFYAGLRRGELMGISVEHINLASGVIKIERAWDAKCRVFVEPKSRAGRRSVPIPAVLRDHLDEHLLGPGRDHGLVFGRTATAPFDADTVAARAKTAWTRAKLDPIGLHEARHTYASTMIAAGVNAKTLAAYMGHASVVITLDRYGHLMPGNEHEAAALLDAYLERVSAEAARTAEIAAD